MVLLEWYAYPRRWEGREGKGKKTNFPLQTQLTLDTDLTQYQREMLNIVHNLANSLLTIIDDILDISKSMFHTRLLGITLSLLINVPA